MSEQEPMHEVCYSCLLLLFVIVVVVVLTSMKIDNVQLPARFYDGGSPSRPYQPSRFRECTSFMESVKPEFAL